MLLAGAIGCPSQPARAADDPYPEAHPAAGVQPRRPANYAPYRYPLSPQELLDKYGAAIGQLARQAWGEIDSTNARGVYKNTRESLAAHPCPDWFVDAKIGMFIDWGPWSVGGYSKPASGGSYPDWYEYSIHRDNAEKESLKDYHAQAWGADIGEDDLINLLSDARLDCRNLARLARECGFRYVVPFLKHHGGFCLWDSSFTRRNSMDWAFHRDFALELSKACKEEGLKFGVYVSVGEWEYPAIRPDGQIGSFGFDGKLREDAKASDCFFLSGKIPVKDYARDYFVPSTKELIDKTHPDLVWYDGAWTNTSDFYLTRDLNAYYYNSALREHQEVCINDRSGSDYRDGKVVGRSDFSTSEFGSGASPLEDAWEECRSFSHNFGYNWTEESDPSAMLSDKACIELLVDVIGRGGNLLLIVSPTGTGEIPPRQLHAIRNMGDWLRNFGPAIYGTRTYRLAAQPKWGRITRSKDGSTVYLLITQWPADGRIPVPVLPIQAIESVQLMHGQGTPRFTQPNDRDGFSVDLSACSPGDPRVNVAAVRIRPASEPGR